MRSKMRPPIASQLESRQQSGIARGSSTAKAVASNRLLRRIADALQVPQSTLYNLPNAVEPVHGPDGDDRHSRNPALDLECLALLQAFGQIRDPKTRGGLLAQVQAAAEQD